MIITHIDYVEANESHLDSVDEFLAPMILAELLLPRSKDELKRLFTHAFLALRASEVVGFAAVEVYSKKLAEIQCLAVDDSLRRQGIGRTLVQLCVARAAEHGVAELMAISASDEMFKSCGFDYSLPNQKRALFIQP